MELIDRYLQCVKQALPRAQQADVVAELSDEILSQVEARQEALGRPLTEDEQAELLKQFGHPWLLAARYRKQLYLVSPAVFPIYWTVLRILLLIVLFAMSVTAVAVVATGRGVGAGIGVLAQYPMAALQTFAWVTLVFFALGVLQVKFDLFGKWDPRTLPKLSKSEQKRSFTETMVGLVFATLAGVWWLVGLKHQFLIFGPGIAFVHFGPVWQTLYPLFVLVILADLTRHVLQLIRPAWEKGYASWRVLVRALNLIVLALLLRANNLIVPSQPAGEQAQAAMKQVNNGIHLVLLVVTLVAAVQLVWDLYRLFFRRPREAFRAAACV